MASKILLGGWFIPLTVIQLYYSSWWLNQPIIQGNWLLPGLEIKQNLFYPWKKKQKRPSRSPPKWEILKPPKLVISFKKTPDLYPFSVSGVLARRLEEQPTGNTWATEKKTAYFRLNPGCLIGILIMVYEIILIYNWVGFHPPYTLND